MGLRHCQFPLFHHMTIFLGGDAENVALPESVLSNSSSHQFLQSVGRSSALSIHASLAQMGNIHLKELPCLEDDPFM